MKTVIAVILAAVVMGCVTTQSDEPKFKIINDCQYIAVKDDNTGIVKYKHYANCNNPKHKEQK